MYNIIDEIKRKFEEISTWLAKNEILNDRPNPKDFWWGQISPDLWVDFNVTIDGQKRSFKLVPSPVFKSFIIDRKYLEAVGTNPNLFGTGDDADVLLALKYITPWYPLKASFEEFRDFLIQENMCYVFEVTGGVVSDKVLRIDLFRMLKEQKEHRDKCEFIGGFFHFLKHFTIEDYPTISRREVGAELKCWEELMINLIRNFYNDGLKVKEGYGEVFESVSAINDSEELLGAYFKAEDSPAYFIRTFFFT